MGAKGFLGVAGSSAAAHTVLMLMAMLEDGDAYKYHGTRFRVGIGWNMLEGACGLINEVPGRV